ncbi:1,4-dihydroxy-6-naphthoate synthase [Bibersteinia trehalosi]|uniref:1,4-dihydroxy-6-naphthoate synthase n=1 Tax=Bibersteinia trehalosi TaxID=47735 RepID=UPI0021AB1379|nr:1,4-dihydroxy-6-naphthoate synthase [Bibersteinia trehalosi]
MGTLSKKVIYHQIVKTEKYIYYKKAPNKLREKGYIIKSVTCDARRGLLKDLFDTPTQICQYHMVAIVMRALRKKTSIRRRKRIKNYRQNFKRKFKK